jgi:hypothetical protein
VKDHVKQVINVQIHEQGIPKDNFHVHQSIDVQEVSQLLKKGTSYRAEFATIDNSRVPKETYTREQWMLRIISWHLHNESLHTQQTDQW